MTVMMTVTVMMMILLTLEKVTSGNCFVSVAVTCLVVIINTYECDVVMHLVTYVRLSVIMCTNILKSLTYEVHFWFTDTYSDSSVFISRSSG